MPSSLRRAARVETCAICGEPGPTVAYFWTGGRGVSLHAACDALWRLERDSRRELSAKSGGSE